MSNLINDWRLYPSRYNLIGSICSKCGKKYLPVISYCAKCGSENLKREKFPKEGRVFSFSIVHVAPFGFEDFAPYAVGLVKLANGVLISSQIVASDFTKIKIGKKVRAVFRKIKPAAKDEVIAYGVKFEVV